MTNILLLILVGNLATTSYRSVPNQTDSTPFNTSTGEHVSKDGVAISQDLLCKDCLRLHHRCSKADQRKGLHYGDWLYIEFVGLKRINDTMNARMKRHLDVWVATRLEEQAFEKKFKGKKLKVFKIPKEN